MTAPARAGGGGSFGGGGDGARPLQVALRLALTPKYTTGVCRRILRQRANAFRTWLENNDQELVGAVLLARA
jgi:hypothetical protein